MPLGSFEYFDPKSIHAALVLKERWGAGASWLAGGTDFLPRARQGLTAPRAVISLKKLATDLALVKENEHELTLGALTTLNAAATHGVVQERLPGLNEAFSSVGAETLQQRVGTVGGNICAETRCIYLNQSPAWRSGLAPCFKLGGEVCHPGGSGADRCRSVCASDGAVMLMALGAMVELRSQEGTRRISLEQFLTGRGEAPLGLGEKELLTGIVISLPGPGGGNAYERLAIRGAIDYPLLSAGASVTIAKGRIGEARVALGSVYAAPLLLKDAMAGLAGQVPEEAALKEAARKAGSHAEPFLVDNVRAELAWRRAVVPVLTERALKKALDRAKEVA